MRNNYFLIVALILLQLTYSQEVIKVDLNTNTEKESKILPEGNYIIHASGMFECENHALNVESETSFQVEGPIITESDSGSKNCSLDYQDTFRLKKRAKIKYTFTVVNSTSDSIVKKITRTYSTINNRKWITSYGFSCISLINSDTYKTISNNNGFKVVKSGSQEKIKALPVMLFSILNLENEKAFIPSAGFGTDLENISVFLGVSKAFAQNLIVTGGVALHKQHRLDSKYSPNQFVTNDLTFEDLHTEYFRVNPFISVTLHLNKNIFKK